MADLNSRLHERAGTLGIFLALPSACMCVVLRYGKNGRHWGWRGTFRLFVLYPPIPWMQWKILNYITRFLNCCDLFLSFYFLLDLFLVVSESCSIFTRFMWSVCKVWTYSRPATPSNLNDSTEHDVLGSKETASQYELVWRPSTGTIYILPYAVVVRVVDDVSLVASLFSISRKSCLVKGRANSVWAPDWRWLKQSLPCSTQRSALFKAR